MDGVQIDSRRSLRFRLSLWLSLVILAVAVVAGIFSFVAALDEAHEWQDDTLRQVAILSGEQQHPAELNRDAGTAGMTGDNPIIVQRISPLQLAAKNYPAAGLALPASLPDGIQTVRIGNDTYRVFIKTSATGERLAVVQGTGERDETARDGALRTLLPFLILVPILLLVVGNMIRRILEPVAVVAREIDQRKELNLHPISDDVLPTEIRPFVIAINRLFDRIRQSMLLQRRFVADAAHELRSPLTALSLQAERLAGAELSAVAQQRLADLRLGIERSRALLDQLLALARAESGGNRALTPVSVQRAFRHVLEDLMPLAQVKRLDIGVVGTTDAADIEVNIREIDLITLIKNLVTNAIHYSPPGGRIDLSAARNPEGIILKVKDSGPGIPKAERERIFDPFYRILGNDEAGSGLGLSIVRAITRRIGAVVTLEDADKKSQTGLCISVIFPDVPLSSAD